MGCNSGVVDVVGQKSRSRCSSRWCERVNWERLRFGIGLKPLLGSGRRMDPVDSQVFSEAFPSWTFKAYSQYVSPRAHKKYGFHA